MLHNMEWETNKPKRRFPDTYVCQWAQKNINIPMKPQKNIQFVKPPIPHEMHVPTATKTEREDQQNQKEKKI